MHTENLNRWQHSHVFDQDTVNAGERRTLIVIAITASMMIVEITAGVVYGSMALFADGLHMASHAVALAINAFAYIYARRHAHDAHFSFGTGKVNALGGFTGAVLLAGFALLMAVESMDRVLHPIDIGYNQAIFVAVLGLIVNGASVFILGHHHDDSDEHHHHGHDHRDHHDHNLRAAYLHVMADALTSLLAIFALLAAKYYGFVWMDPAVGIIGAILIARWSVGLLKGTANVLLDQQAPDRIQVEIREQLEHGDDRLTDLHVWSIGPNIYAAIIGIVSDSPASPEDYKQRLPDHLKLAHVTIEVHKCSEHQEVTE